MIYHMIAFGLGFCLDLLLGDPYWLPHPIRVIGNFIGILEKRMNKKECSEKYLVRAGIGMVALVLLTVLMVTTLLLILAYRIHPVAGVILEMIMTYQILAAKCLKVESMKVNKCLKENDLLAARHAVSMIVGRDTESWMKSEWQRLPLKRWQKILRTESLHRCCIPHLADRFWAFFIRQSIRWIPW